MPNRPELSCYTWPRQSRLTPAYHNKDEDDYSCGKEINGDSNRSRTKKESCSVVRQRTIVTRSASVSLYTGQELVYLSEYDVQTDTFQEYWLLHPASTQPPLCPHLPHLRVHHTHVTFQNSPWQRPWPQPWASPVRGGGAKIQRAAAYEPHLTSQRVQRQSEQNTWQTD